MQNDKPEIEVVGKIGDATITAIAELLLDAVEDSNAEQESKGGEQPGHSA